MHGMLAKNARAGWRIASPAKRRGTPGGAPCTYSWAFRADNGARERCHRPFPGRPRASLCGTRPCGRASGPRALRAGAAARVGLLLGEGAAHKALHAYVVPHTELLEPSGDASRNPCCELYELLVVLNNESHLATRLPASQGTVNHGSEGWCGGPQERRHPVHHGICEELVVAAVLGTGGLAGVREVADLDERAGGRVAHQDPEGPGPRLAPHAADAALQGVVEAAAEQGGAPATPRCARGPDPAAVEHLEPLRTRIAARIRMQRDEEGGPVARHGDAPLDRDEGVVGAGQQYLDREPRREPARDHLGHLEHDVLLEHAADALGAGVAPAVPGIEDDERWMRRQGTSRGAALRLRGRWLRGQCWRGRLGCSGRRRVDQAG